MIAPAHAFISPFPQATIQPLDFLAANGVPPVVTVQSEFAYRTPHGSRRA